MAAPLLLALLAAPAAAEVIPQPSPGDPRIQTVDYDGDQVVRLGLQTGFTVAIEFAADERIENVAIGEATGWQVTPNKRADHLFIKPTDGAIDTNLIVLTDARRYSFLLSSGSVMGISPYIVRFRYAGIDMAPPTVVHDSQASYRVKGAKELIPQGMADDGLATTIRWPAQVAIPAVYAVDEQGDETLINGAMREGAFVVDAIAPRFIFRSGKRKAVATRQVAKVQP
ncbi:TrbG/VirB9 family P-type conjugative transfer protein [Sphingobium sp. BYY-5]|uniref:TrbG/VirB9 family P-type conjugative transfer protein n=1 Tax=Sphingobium sp. BYY-5 TaxID=2926400 RepID=UPI001FA76253|nr:TrbG/VirB9 family P-type conjugative transfer protein [Sphingobium sp. BYY-5]MCI4590394.1 TrbG/VirB9 family P-type conjugative transfer protein [Sphingobium sp. BYY-5]MCI4591490.1 TrbG/VirB9 family P-type conjugative transfer protein [Sphingobium sp. BYY-5]